MRAYTIILATVVFVAIWPVSSHAKTLVYCAAGGPEGFDSARHATALSFAASRRIFDQLVAFQGRTTMLEPALAQSWSVSGDMLEYTFNLRRNVEFHSAFWFQPSRPFNADDVVFSFERQMNPEHPFYQNGAQTYPYFHSMRLDSLIEAVEKVDEYTVRFRLSRPEASFLSMLAMDFGSILSQEFAFHPLVGRNPEVLDIMPIGTGPFILDKYVPGESLLYRANDRYWKGAPKIDWLKFDITPNAAARWEKTKNGDCHIAAYPAIEDVPAIEGDSNVRLISQTSLNVSYVLLNTTRPPFDDPRVRRALNMATDKQRIIEEIFKGFAKPAKTPLPPISWAYNDEIAPYPYDPDAAAEMLEDLGVAPVSVDLWTVNVQRPYAPDPERMARMVKEDWAKVGIDATVHVMGFEKLLQGFEEGNYDAVLIGWIGDTADPDNFMHTLLSCDSIPIFNPARWCHEEFESLVKRAKVSSDVAERTRLYREAQVIFKDQAPWVPLAHSTTLNAVRKEVIGLYGSPFQGFFFDAVDLKE